MGQNIRKSLWQKVCAMVVTTALLISSVGILPSVFTIAEATEEKIIEIMPTVDFNNWADEEVDAGALYTGNSKPAGEIFYAMNNGGTVSVKNRGKDDKYLVNEIREFVYTSGNNQDYLGRAAALESGEQMVFSFETYSGRDNGINVDIRMGNDLGPTPMFALDDGKLCVYDCVPHYASNGETITNGTVIGEYTLPQNKWLKIDMVYTRLGAERDGSACDSLKVYVDGRAVKFDSVTAQIITGAEIPLADSILDGTVQRFTVGRGIIDNMGATHYTDGEKYAPNVDVVSKTIVPLIDFDSYETLTIPVVATPTGAAQTARLTGWSSTEPTFSIQNDGRQAGTVYANIDTKEGSTTDKYLNQVYNLVTATSRKDTAVAVNYFTSNNSGLKSITLTEGQQLEYSVSVHSGKYFTMYNRKTAAGDSDTPGILNYLFTVTEGKLYVFDGTKGNHNKTSAMGYVTLPENSWVDIKAVYTAGDGIDNNEGSGGSDDTVAIYVGPELQLLTKNDGSGEYVSADGINRLAADYHSITTDRLTFSGATVFDNFSVTKYTEYTNVDDEETTELLGINHYPNDFTYFHSERVMLGSMDYEFAKLSATDGNSYIIEPSDKKNQFKGDRLILTRESGSELATSYVSLDMPTYNVITDYIPADRHYKYFLIEGMFNISSEDLGGQIITLCDENGNNSGEQTPVALLDGRMIVGRSSKQLSVTDDEGSDKWYHLRMILNLERGTYDAILDGELMCQGEDIYGDVRLLTSVKTVLNQGAGSLRIREMEVTGLSKEPTLVKTDAANDIYDFKITKTSQFIDDNLTRQYLSDKVVFHGEGDMTYNKGAKTEYGKGSFVYDGDRAELYVPLDILNANLDSAVTYSGSSWKNGVSNLDVSIAPIVRNDEILAPVKALTWALGYTSEYYQYGKMVIVSSGGKLPVSNDDDAKPWLDGNFYSSGWNSFYLTELTEAQEISNFVFYDRPTANQLEETFYSKEQAHPRVVLTPEKVATIKEKIAEDKETGAYADVYASRITTLETSARNLLNNGYVAQYVFNTDDEYRTLSAAGTFSNRMVSLGLVYQLSSDEELKAACAQDAIDNLKIVSTFPDFNYGHVIDAGVWLYGCAIGFDWFFDAMTEEERAEIAEGILDIGLRPMNRAFYAGLPSALGRASSKRGNMGNANHFVKWKSNFIPYTQHGLVTASLAFAEYDGEICFDTIEKAVRNWEYSNLGLYPEGGWLEGKGYLGVVHTNTAIAFASLLNVMGDEFNILNAKGFEESMVAVTQLSSLTGTFSYSDEASQGGAVNAIPAALSFYADYYEREDLHKIRQWRYTVGDKSTWNYLDLVYYNHFDDQTDITDTKKAFKELDTINYTEGTEIVAVHEDWSSYNSMFFAMAGGPTRHYHFHTDGGDFSLTMDGNRWSYEMGTGNYNIGTNFTKYAGRAEGHNTLVIKPDEDPYLTQGTSGYAWTAQKEQSVAKVMDYGETVDGAYATLDMSTLYEDFGAERVHRGALIDDEYNALTIRDEIVFPEEEEYDGWWFMHTKADYEFIDANTIKLSLYSHMNLEEHKAKTKISDKDGDGDVDDDDYEIWYNSVAKNLYVQVQVDGADSYEVKMMPAEPLPSSPVVVNDPTNTNGVNKVAIYYEGSGEIDITVRMSNTLADEINTTPIEEWTFSDIIETEDGFECNIKGAETSRPMLVAVGYEGGKMTTANLGETVYDRPRGQYKCSVGSIADDTEECVLYLWDRERMQPLSEPVRVRMSDLTIIE